ncbi:MAG: hypothetical protein SGCHY_002116 [Lobulomycetales sp.]
MRGDLVGFIGLGQMGFHMANNLIRKLPSSTIFSVADALPATVSRFTSSNASARVLAPDATPSIIFTMLPAGPHVRKVYADLFARKGFAPGTLFVDCSTIDPATSKSVAAQAKSLGHVMIDAPVSGGTPGAEARVTPLLELMGEKVVYCGDNGNGQVAKIANNMLLGISMIAVSEAMNLGTKLGMEPKLLAEIFNTSSGRCWSSDTYNPYPGVMENVPSSRDYSGGFGVNLMAKDMQLAVTAAKEAGLGGDSVVLGQRALEMYKEIGAKEEFKDKDFGSVFKWIRQQS